MKFYWGPHTCAIGTHILLEEVGASYDAVKIDVQGGATEEDWFRAINPKGKVPTLVLDDGSVLTEFVAIATWLARTYPEAGLLPQERDEEVRAMSISDYAVGTIHGQGFGRIFKPGKFEPQDPVHQGLGLGKGSVRHQGQTMVRQAFEILDHELGHREWVAGDRFGLADAAVFYVARWAPDVGIDLPIYLAAHLRRMKERPSVGRVLSIWDES